MLTVNFYRFRKRVNSTKRPGDIDGVYPLTGTFNEPTSIIEPSISIDNGAAEAPLYNYCYIPDFQRYYFITNWINDMGLWTGTMTVDPLATWKEEIEQAQEYVLRSSAEFDGAIMDSFYPIIAGQSQNVTFATDWPFSTDGEEGSYVVGIINGDDQGFGAVSYYVFTDTTLKLLNTALLGNADWISTEWVDIKEDILKTMFNPYQYIASVMYYPLQVTQLVVNPTPLLKVPFGWWELPMFTPCWRLTFQGQRNFDFSIKVPKHPQAKARGKYLNCEPYSRYALDAWPWGRIHLDSTTLVDCDEIKGQIRVDLVSGEATLFLASHFIPPNGGANIEIRTGQLGCPVQLAQISQDYLQGAANAIGAVSDLADGLSTDSMLKVALGGKSSAGAALDVVGSAVNGINSVSKAISPMLETGGTNGSRACLGITPRLFAEFNHITNTDDENYGRPLMAVRTLGDIPGYIKCANPDISISGTAQENNMIKEFMSGGFFLE